MVADPDPDKAVLLQPILHELEGLRVPHALFINKIDQARGSLRDLLEALQPVSGRAAGGAPDPDLGGRERHRLRRSGAGARLRLPAGQAVQAASTFPTDLSEREAEARFHMLEQIADFDDELMEQLLSDVTPDRDAVFADLVREMNEGLIVPVFFGSAAQRLRRAPAAEGAAPRDAGAGASPPRGSGSTARAPMC